MRLDTQLIASFTRCLVRRLQVNSWLGTLDGRLMQAHDRQMQLRHPRQGRA